MRRQRANGGVRGGERRAGGKLDLHEHVAAILRGLELEADDTQRNQGDRCGGEDRAHDDDRNRIAQRAGQNAIGIPGAQARKAARERRDKVRRLPIRAQRPVTG